MRERERGREREREREREKERERERERHTESATNCNRSHVSTVRRNTILLHILIQSGHSTNIICVVDDINFLLSIESD
jgi:hypothetical protein